MTITPYVYQSVAIRKAVAVLRKTNKALIDMATGLGKTFTAAFIVKALKSRRVLFLVHNNFILDNAMDEFKLVLGEKVKMAVYNGQSKNGSSEADIVFATWQTMQSNLKKWKRNHFDIVVVDEAHHSEAETWKPVVKYFTGMKLGLTATPDRQDEADIRGTFGPEVVKITLEEAIARGWLPRIEYHVITDESLDEEKLVEICREIREHHRRFSISEIDKRLFIRKRDAEIARIINGYDEKAIIFCASVQHTERFVKYLKLGDTFHSSKVKGNSKKTWDLNQKVLDHLKNGVVRRVCAVNAFNEGVNVPSVGLVAFCRVTGSMTIFRQQLGRGLRPGKDKLIVLDFVGNLERVKAVMELMNRVADFHERITSSKEREREGYSRSKFEITGAGFEFTFSDEIVNLMEVLEATQVDFYPTWQEASEAAVKLGIPSVMEYFRSYRKDTKLPSRPNQMYSNFPGWKVFLGGSKKYPTWETACDAAAFLQIKNQRDYSEKYSNDPRLPSSPRTKYKDFPGWEIFTKKRSRFNLYKSWQLAMNSAVNLGIRTSTQYWELSKNDERLPRSPATYYKNFPGWKKFLGKK
jgi:superfamily II DNA or RNA helicase